MKVITVCVGNTYSIGDVEKLHRGLSRNTTAFFDFEVIRRSKYPGWWAKMDIFPAKERTVYLDLDIIVVGNVDFLFKYYGPFAVIQNRGGEWATGVMCIEAGWGEELKRRFERDPEEHMRRFLVDDNFIADTVPTADFWLDGEEIVSYKRHCLDGLPANARLVHCHGRPKPNELTHLDWVQKHWEGR